MKFLAQPTVLHMLLKRHLIYRLFLVAQIVVLARNEPCDGVGVFNRRIEWAVKQYLVRFRILSDGSMQSYELTDRPRWIWILAFSIAVESGYDADGGRFSRWRGRKKAPTSLSSPKTRRNSPKPKKGMSTTNNNTEKDKITVQDPPPITETLA